MLLGMTIRIRRFSAFSRVVGVVLLVPWYIFQSGFSV
ncbi:hypothetical protein EVA_12469 [gut metagenome]|uniref:Uncharacterized protein n=1 Tax=gut metagenome TaxID=749906 RepID=J9FXY9_9ZZZZ